MSDHGAIDEQVRELVAAHRPELERLVDEALEHELNLLVADRLTNGNGVTHEPAEAPRARSEPATKACAGCGRELELGKFERGRNRCRECRRREHREREQRRGAEQAPAEPDRPAITAHELAKRVHRPTGALDGATLESWLVGERLAISHAGRLELTALGLELAGAIA